MKCHVQTKPASIMFVLAIAFAIGPSCEGSSELADQPSSDVIDDSGDLGFADTGGDTSDDQGSSVEAQLLKSELERDESPDVEPSELAELVGGNSDFAFELFAELMQEEDGNALFSPLSISMALAMTYAGAEGETEADMADTLHFTLDETVLHPAFNALDLALESRGEGAQGADGEGFRLHLVNALWGQQGYSFLSDFLDVLGVNYGAGMHLLDFAGFPDQCREIINQWVSDQTEERITDLLPEGSITGMTRLVLTNAIYFNAAWDSVFPEESTSDDTFTRLDESEVTVATMHMTEELGYAEGAGYQAVELLYDGQELSMVVILPADGTYTTFEAGLTAVQVDGIVDALEPALVTLSMPKFGFESEYLLNEALEALGMASAFGGEADFSGIDGTGGLFISRVLHKAFIALDEYGTEAAAATAVVMDFGIGTEMSLDRPFLFFIRDIPTDTVLFIGRVLDPSL